MIKPRPSGDSRIMNKNRKKVVPIRLARTRRALLAHAEKILAMIDDGATISRLADEAESMSEEVQLAIKEQSDETT
jgi:hypothetical protein